MIVYRLSLLDCTQVVYVSFKYRIAGNFQKILFNEYFGKIFSKFLVIFSFFATGLKNFKAPFCKKIQKIPEVSEISKNKVLRKFPAIW